MKSLLALVAIALLSLGVTACGDASKALGPASQASSNAAANGRAPARTASSAIPTASGATTAGKDTNDLDDDAAGNDDILVVDFGHAASAADRQAVTAVVKRYYAVAAAGDGAKACSMLASTVAEGVPEEYGQTSGSPGLGGKTCAVVMSKLFKRRHKELAADFATLKVTLVRIEGGKGLAVLSFARTPEPRKIAVRSEGGAWKIKELIDSGMP